MIKYLIIKFSSIGRKPILFFKSGFTLVIGVLCALCSMCYEDKLRGSVGMEIYYAPMLDYIMTALIIFWAGTFLLDIAEKERSAGK